VRVEEKAEKSAISNERRESYTLAEERDCASRFPEENVALKGYSHEIFCLHFFHQTDPPGTLIHGLKSFCRNLFFREAI
jgi:hypothetical protein